MWTKVQIRTLSGLFGRYYAFPTGNKEDEFIIVREDGKRQGIFKEWAPPVLPFLSGYKVDEWRIRASQQPAFLEKELRRAWRNSWLIDRDLTAKFSVESLPEHPKQRTVELVKRLKLAFGLMGPFYHLEAMVDDPTWLGIDMSKILPSTGEFDVAAFFLSSAFKKYVVARAGDWHGLDWPEIRRFTALVLADSSHAGVLLGMAGLLGVEPEHLIFAANALEWISARVGGKKEDIEERQAIEELKGIIEKSREVKKLDCPSVLADMNARIRFFNWLPLIEGPNNFSGRSWTYASVCDTAEDLFKTLDAHPELWQADFRDIYQQQLRPQILNLDAASAKGRFLLDLIVNEGRLDGDFINQQIKPYRYQRSNCLIHGATRRFNQPCLVGTKPVGLALASRVLGDKYVLPGFVISMDNVENKRYEQFSHEARAHWPEVKLWAVRSSSMDEGTARGVYETILRVRPAVLAKAIKQCINSYNQKGAASFRRTKGLNDQDRRVEIAVLLQSYQVGVYGGVATVADSAKGCGRHYQISVAQTAEQVTSGGETQEFDFSDDSQIPNKFKSLVSILNRLHKVFGEKIQVEWVMDSAGKVIILQMEFIFTQLNEHDVRQESNKQLIEIVINSLVDIRQTVALLETQRPQDALRLIIGPKINPKSFQGELFTMVVRFNKRIREISLANQVSLSSHFANICRHFGIKLV